MARKAHMKQFSVLLPVYLNTYMTGTTTGWLPCAIYLYTEIESKITLAPFDYFSLVSTSEAGKILLALPASWMMDKYGRVVNNKAAGYLHVVGWVIICFTDNLWVIYFARIILGGATACAIAAALIMVGEITSATIRGRMTSLMQIFILLGNATPAVIMAWYPSSRVLAYFITALSILCLVANQLLIESPYYLVSKSQTKQARENLAYLRTGYTEDEIDGELDIIQMYIRNEQRHTRSISNFIGHLRLPFVRKPLITMFLLNFFNNSSGIPMLLSVCTIVLGENSLIAKKCYFIVTIIVALIFGGAVITLIESFSRKHFYIFGAISTGILQAFNGFTWYIYNKEKSQYWYWLFFIGNLALGIFWNGILSPLKGTVRSEILPQAAKSTENIFSLLAQALALGSSFLIYHNTSLNVAYWIYAICCEVLALVIYVQVPDGRGKTLAWIQMELNDELA